ncbi:hypothetical protein [Aquibaculum sediminis]|uniref:hypothetical protein n=1 Tax=Aquibaculum sediminis TaxID=3231907 RepID=UPI003455660A
MFRIIVPLLGLLFLTSACSSIVEGTSQTVTINSDPSGATCSLERGGSVVAVVNPTPGSVSLGKSKDHVSVNCEKEGYQKAAAPLDSSFQGMTFGNVLFGGLIGVAVDASTGAMHKYPSSVMVLLPPEEFGTLEERDIWFDRRAARIEDEAADAMSKVRKNCQSNNNDARSCDSAIGAIQQEREARLAANEAQRSATRVRYY